MNASPLSLAVPPEFLETTAARAAEEETRLEETEAERLRGLRWADFVADERCELLLEPSLAA